MWASHITDDMRRMEFDPGRFLSTCLHAYDICICANLDVVLVGRLEDLPCGSYPRPSVLVSMISMTGIVDHPAHVCSSGDSTPVVHLPRE
jgi:hypothetical protein